MKVCIIGLGRIGLPLAVQCASKGFMVTGCDIKKETVDSINKGISPVRNEPELDERLKDVTAKGLLSETTDVSEAVGNSNVIVVIVPLILNGSKEPDYRALDSATNSIVKGLQKNTLIIYETTLPVGTTSERILPLLENSGLKAGEDFFLAFSPERVSSGRIFYGLNSYPKIVAGIEEESTRRAVEFYQKILDAEILAVENTETAEAVKLFGMVYRDVNIALANEFARFCQRKGLDIQEVIKASNTNPYSHILNPGCGTGGHCLPTYPYFLLNDMDLTLVREARRINEGMPEYVVNLLKDIEGKKILVLGLTYRLGVKEIASSPGIEIIKRLKALGMDVFAHDPMLSREEIEGYGFKYGDIENLDRIDAIILATGHKEYQDLNLEMLKEKGVKAIIDGRNFLDRERIRALGILYRGLGR